MAKDKDSTTADAANRKNQKTMPSRTTPKNTFGFSILLPMQKKSTNAEFEHFTVNYSK